MSLPSYETRNHDPLFLKVKALLADNPSLGRRELSKLTNDSAERCRLRKEWFIREQSGGPEISPDRLIRILEKAKTGPELQRILGENWEALIRENVPGFNLFEDRNSYNEIIYILHPEIKARFQLLPKPWTHTIGIDSSGELDPCITIQMPLSSFIDDELILVPLYDVHLGHHAHREDKFLSYINWIRQNDNVFAMLGGDLLENALDDGRGMTYDSSSPDSQIDDAVDKLSLIAHKIFFAIPGNHEWRTYKRAGIDPTKIICRELQIPYFSGPVFMRLLGATRFWNFIFFHGKGNSQTKGGKLNAAQRLGKFTEFVHFMVSGHTHDPMVNSETVIVYNPEESNLKYMTRWTVVAQSFMKWKGTYAYRAGYPPPGKGGVTCHLMADGEYKATMV